MSNIWISVKTKTEWCVMYFPVEVSRVPAVTSQTVTADTWANLFSLTCNQNVSLQNKMTNWPISFMHAEGTQTEETGTQTSFTAVGLCSSNSFIKKTFLQQNYWTEGQPSVYLPTKTHKNTLKGGSSEKDATPRSGRKKNLKIFQLIWPKIGWLLWKSKI